MLTKSRLDAAWHGVILTAMTDPVDWPTIIASGMAGALAGGLVSWVAAPQLANREERGRNHLEARQAIAAAVSPVLTQVRQYQAHARSSLGRDPQESDLHISDLNFCAMLLAKAEDLQRWRRQLVRRRLAQLFGPATVEICDVHGPFAADPQASLGVMINRQYYASKNPNKFAQPDKGKFDAALRSSPNSREIAKLLASLERLKDAR